mgnify:CR=1 FL=1
MYTIVSDDLERIVCATHRKCTCIPNFIVEPTKPRSITFTDQGTEMNSGRLRRKYKVSWNVSFHYFNTNMQFSQTSQYRMLQALRYM